MYHEYCKSIFDKIEFDHTNVLWHVFFEKNALSPSKMSQVVFLAIQKN